MNTRPEQFSAVRKARVEAQINFMERVAANAVHNAEQVLALNVSTTRAAMETSTAALRQLLAVRQPGDLLALTTQSQASFERLLSYSRQLLSIAGNSQAALLKQAAPVIAPAFSDDSKADDSKADDSKADEPKADEPKADEPKAEVPKAEPMRAPEAHAALAEPGAPAAESTPSTPAVKSTLAAPPAKPTRAAPPVKSTPAAPPVKPTLAAPPVKSTPAAKAKPIAKAVSKVAAKALAPTPAAAPVSASAKPALVTALKAVEASPPPAPVPGKPSREPRQLDMLAPKAKKKK